MGLASALGTVNWLAVLVAALATFMLGGLWYGPVAGKWWMQASGMTEERARQGNMPLIFGVSFVLQFLAAVVLAMFIGPASVGFGAVAGLVVGLFWVGTALGVIYLFEHRSFAHWATNAGYQTLAFLLMGAILGAWA